MYYFKLNKNQIKKLIEAHDNNTNAIFQITSNKIFKGENIYYLDKIQLDQLKNAKEKKIWRIGAASAVVDFVTSIVNTVNDYKHKNAMEIETIRHNKAMENKGSGLKKKKKKQKKSKK
ncbi:hypothetical protein QTP88_011729 [Uroleucon formosanum]